MTEQTKMLGTVSYAPHSYAYYMRVQIPDWKTGIPLSVKATFSGFDLCDFEKGDVVEVERYDPQDARRHRVLRLMKAVEPDTITIRNSTGHDGVYTKVTNANAFKNKENFQGSQKMIKGKDHVKFFLPKRYFQPRPTSNGMTRETCVKILHAVFGPPTNSGSSWGSQMVEHPEGFWIVCRSDQFSRFIIARYDADECINGIKDLKPAIVGDWRARLHDQIVDDFEGQVGPDDVRDILRAAGVPNTAVLVDDVFNVSKNFRNRSRD